MPSANCARSQQCRDSLFHTNLTRKRGQPLDSASLARRVGIGRCAIRAQLRRLSGREVSRIFQDFGFVIVGQRGSHMKLNRITARGTEILTIPPTRNSTRETLRAILRQASRFVAELELRPHFYSDS